MPTVGMKKFSYTAKSKKAAKDYAKATGETDTATAAGGQARGHAFLLKTLGVKQIIVAINKMDAVEYKEAALVL